MIGLTLVVALLGPDPRPPPQPGWDEGQLVPDPVTPAPAPLPAPTAAPAPTPGPPQEASVVAPVPGPSAPPTHPGTQFQRRRTLALRGAIVGFAGFGMGYVVSASIGAVYLVDADTLYATDPERGRRFGRRMLLPLVGPFLAIDPARTTFGRVGAVALGVVQVGSLVGALVGIGRYVTLGKDRATVRVSGVPGPGGGAMSLVGRF